MKNYLLECTGWTGAFFALLAFFVDSQSALYLGRYSLGCILMALYGYAKKAPASWILNLIFLLVAFIALVRIFLIGS